MSYDINTPRHRFEYIEAYYNNELEGEELRNFKLLLANDEEFAREVDEYKHAVTNRAPETTVAVTDEKAASKSSAWFRYSTTTAMLTLVFIATMIFWLYSPADQLCQDISVLLDVRGVAPVPCRAVRSAEVNFTAESISAAYARCEYEKCIAMYEQSAGMPIQATFYAANAYFALGLDKEAQNCFKKVSMSTESARTMRELSEWYVVAIDLDNNNAVPAERLLNKIYSSSSKHKHRQQLEWHLVLNYLKNERFDDADQIMGNTGDGNLLFKMQVKILKWKNRIS